VQVRELKRQITLEELKSHKAGALSSMALFTTARLSVQPVSQTEWDFVLSLEEN
jgi:predicted RNA-binding protein with PUA-like domain